MQEMTVSNPERRVGHKLLPTIPVEIYMIIFDQLRYDPEDEALSNTKSILANLALVCRLFSSLIVPKLFAKFVFEGRQGGAPMQSKERACALWLDRISAGEADACARGALVKELAFRGWRPPVRTMPLTPTSPSSFPLSRYAGIVPRFSNLRSLELFDTSITRKFFEAVMGLQKLRTLCIRECDFGGADTEINVPDTAPCLAELEVSQVDNLLPYLPALVRLAGTRSLRSLQTTDWQLARAILDAGGALPLQKLDVPLVSKDTAILGEFLDRTPSLLDLSITGPSDSSDRSYILLKKASLPQLRRLRCPPHLLPALAQDRAFSLQRLDLMDINDWMFSRMPGRKELLNPLEGRTLRALQVPVCLYATHPLGERLSQVEELVICFPLSMLGMDCERVVKTACTAKGQALGVRRLELQFLTTMLVQWVFDLQLQHRMIVKHLAPAFPAATQIAVGDALEWHRGSGTAWRPVVPAREYFKSSVLMKLATESPMRMTEFDGALAALFRDDSDMSSLVCRLCGESERLARR